MLGPLVNPCSPKNQLTGVFNLELARLYNYLLQKTNINFTILYSLDGYDEISLTSPVKAIGNDFEKLITAKEFGTEQIKAKSIQGGNNVKSSAKIFMDILQNKGTRSQEDVVCANAGMAIATFLDLSPVEGFKLAKESLMSGKAFEAFNKLQNISKE